MSPSKDTEESPVDVEITPDTDVLSGDENKENVETPAAEMTFEEWKIQQEQIRSKPIYNIRKANEGEKVNKGVKELKKQTEEEKEEDGSLFFPKKYYEEKLKTSGRVKETMCLDFQFTAGDNRHLDSERGRRGGRGRGRGTGRGRGSDRGDRGDANGRDDSPVADTTPSCGFGGFGTTPTDDAEIQLENDQEFPHLG